MIDIANQRFNGSVSPLGIFMHRGLAQHVEIAPRCFSGPQNSVMFGGNGGRLLRFAVHDGEFGLGRRFLRQVKRKPPGQQFIENDAQGINVGAGACPVALELLRSGIGGRHEPQGRPGRVPGLVEAFKLFGDSEIQQLHRAVFLHENVGRLQVPVNDRLRVSVLNGLAHRAEQPQALFDRTFARAAVIRERRAFDKLHDEPRGSVGKTVRIIEPRNRGVIQVRERSLLALKAGQARGRQPRIAQNLDRHQAAEILPFGKIHDTHAPLAQNALDPVRPELLKRKRFER